MPAVAGIRHTPDISFTRSHWNFFSNWRHGDRKHRLRRVVARYALSLASLAIPAAITFALASHPSLGPVVSLSYVIAVSAVAWWAGALPAILVSCAITPVLMAVVTHGKAIVPPHVDPMGLILCFLISVLVSRVATSRKRVEEVLRSANENLENRVQERTADLSKTAASLESEIAKHRKTEGQLRQSEQRYRLLSEDSPLPMEVFDPETLAFLAVNKAAEELYGYTREEFLYMTLLELQPPEEVPSGIPSKLATRTSGRTIRELRRSYPSVKIIAISGASEGTYLKAARKLGADVVLPKPLVQKQVMQMAETLLA